MSMYTEIYVNVDLKPETPDEVIETLQAICDGEADSPHLNDKPARWPFLFNDGSNYTPLTSVGKLTYDDIRGHWSLLGKGDIKNYAGEIEDFFEYIKPWCQSGTRSFLGYHRYEGNVEPTLVYAGESA